jgi:hypothetical protein
LYGASLAHAKFLQYRDFETSVEVAAAQGALRLLRHWSKG